MQTADGDALMTFRRPWYDRIYYYVGLPFFVLMIPVFALAALVGEELAGTRAFFGVWVIGASFGVWYMAFRGAMSFACTTSGIALTTVIGRRHFIPWDQIREYKWLGPFGRTQIGRGLPRSNRAVLTSEGHPRFYMDQMSAEPLAELEDLVRQYSSARIVGGRLS